MMYVKPPLIWNHHVNASISYFQSHIISILLTLYSLTTILCYYFLDMVLRAKVAIRSKMIIENKSRCCIFNVKSHTQQNNKNNIEKNISSYRQQWCSLWKNKMFHSSPFLRISLAYKMIFYRMILFLDSLSNSRTQ